MKTHPATIHRPGSQTGVDDYGNLVYGPATDIEANYYRVRRQSATELDQNRQTLVVSVDAAFVAGTDIRETDEVTLDGTRYAVQGVYAEKDALPFVKANLEAVS